MSPSAPPTPCHCSGCGDVIIDTQHGVHGRLSSSTAGFRWAATWSKSDVEAPPAQEAGLSPDVLQQWRTKQLARFGQVCGVWDGVRVLLCVVWCVVCGLCGLCCVMCGMGCAV